MVDPAKGGNEDTLPENRGPASGRQANDRAGGRTSSQEKSAAEKTARTEGPKGFAAKARTQNPKTPSELK